MNVKPIPITQSRSPDKLFGRGARQGCPVAEDALPGLRDEGRCCSIPRGLGHHLLMKMEPGRFLPRS